MTALECLERICNPDRPHIAKPWIVEFEGRKWTIATDGTAMVGVARELDCGPAPEKAPADEHVHNALTGTPTHAFELSAIRAWAGPPEWPTVAPCEYCFGVGKVRVESVATDWIRECRECNGTRTHRMPPTVREGYFFEVPVDRNLVARAIDGPSDGIVCVCFGVDRQLLFFGVDWRAAVMPLRQNESKDPPRFPVLP